MKIPDMTVNHAVLSCPACHKTVYAALKVEPRLADPKATSLRVITLTADPRVIGLAVNHRCGGAEFPAEAEDDIEETP